MQGRLQVYVHVFFCFFVLFRLRISHSGARDTDIRDRESRELFRYCPVPVSRARAAAPPRASPPTRVRAEVRTWVRILVFFVDCPRCAVLQRFSRARQGSIVGLRKVRDGESHVNSMSMTHIRSDITHIAPRRARTGAQRNRRPKVIADRVRVRITCAA